MYRDDSPGAVPNNELPSKRGLPAKYTVVDCQVRASHDFWERGAYVKESRIISSGQVMVIKKNTDGEPPILSGKGPRKKKDRHRIHREQRTQSAVA